MRSLLIVISLFISSLAIGQTSIAKKSSDSNVEMVYTTIESKDVPTLLKSWTSKIQFIDTRSAEEFKNGAVDGAINIDISKDKKQLERLDKNETYLVYCYAGGKSVHLANQMKELGFRRVITLSDGYRVLSKITSDQ